MDSSKPTQPVPDMSNTDDEPKAQKKQVCRFFTSKGKGSTVSSYTRYGRPALALNTLCYMTSHNAANADDPLQVVALEMLAHMPTLLAKKDKPLGQNRTGKATVLLHQRTNSNGGISLRLSMTPESYALNRTSRIPELSKLDRSRDATNPR
jgi:hypothetical protein